jgi:hypothetical protein
MGTGMACRTMGLPYQYISRKFFRRKIQQKGTEKSEKKKILYGASRECIVWISATDLALLSRDGERKRTSAAEMCFQYNSKLSGQYSMNIKIAFRLATFKTDQERVHILSLCCFPSLLFRFHEVVPKVFLLKHRH